MNYSFKVDDIFSVQRCANLKSELCTPGNIHYVTRTALNNGVQNLCGNNDYINDGNCIIIGGESAVAFYQNEPFVTGNNITVLRNEKMSELSGLYIVSVLNKFTPLYSYSKAWNTKRVRETVISLPVIESDDPDHVYTPDDIDWDYMTEYIRRLEEEHIRRLEEYLKVAGFESTILTPEEQEALRKFRTGGVKFRIYRICDLFFRRTIRGIPKSEEDLTPRKEGYHIFGQNIKYQHSQKILAEEKYLQNVDPKYPILAYTSSVGEIGIIDESFYRTGNNGAFQGLFPKTKIKKEPMLYILSVLKKQFSSFGYATCMSGIESLMFSLPSTPSGEPDYDLMSAYIRALEKKTVQKLKENYLNEEKATRKIIETGN